MGTLKSASMAAAASIALSSCQYGLMGPGYASPERIASMSNRELCSILESDHDGRIARAVQSRDFLPEDELRLARSGTIREGMSEMGLICSWGDVGLFGRINTSVSAGTLRKQYVYRACSSCRASYVYVRDGKVTGWQQ